MSARCLFVCGVILLLFTNGANAARYQRTKEGKTFIWNNLRGVAEQATWSGRRDLDGYATGEGTLTWYRLGKFVNSYTGKMVHGKFEGPVIKEQGQTRLQTTFVNGEKAGDWSEPGSIESHTPTPAPKQESPKPVETPRAEETPVEQQLLPTPIPSPSPARFPTPRPTPTATPSATPTPVATPTPKPSPSPTPSPTATPSPSPTPAPSPPQTRSPSPKPTATATPTPSPVEQPAKKDFRLDQAVEGRDHESLQLGGQPPSLASPVETVPRSRSSTSPPITQSASPAASPPEIDPTQKPAMIEEFRKQTESVLAQVRDATGNFREIDRVDTVVNLPVAVSANVASLANRARDFRAKLGYETAFHESLADTETVDALTVVDLIRRAFPAGDAPAARSTLLIFLKRYPEPPGDNQKRLWRYLTSAMSLCDRLKNEAETHLLRAQSLSSAGKKSEALREYQEIYRIYPNPVTAKRIRLLENQPR